MTHGYPCPACGFLTFDEPPGSYDICPVCGWEDGAVQLRYPALRGGANAESLWESQQHVLLKLPLDVRMANGIERCTRWRPLRPEENTKIKTAPASSLEYFDAAASAAPQYYRERSED
ncbi:MAG: CPCC family cysteine-rich protein [Planctomycetaceae bacterium]